jgi:hypothetical protein
MQAYWANVSLPRLNPWAKAGKSWGLTAAHPAPDTTFMKAAFVTATGTDIGKTYVTAGIIRAMREQGRPASAIKPVMSGYDPGRPEASDAGILLAAMGKPVNAETVAAMSGASGAA